MSRAHHLLIPGRGVDFSPRDIPGLALWLPSEGLADPTWTGRAGGINGTWVNSPTIAASANFNGKLTATLNGTDEYATANGAGALLAGDDIGHTTFSCARPTSLLTAIKTLWHTGAPASSNSFFSYGSIRNTTGVIQASRRGTGGQSLLASVATASVNTSYIVAHRFNSAAKTVDVWLNGTKVLDGVSSDVDTMSPTLYSIGARVGSTATGDRFFEGEYAEHLMYTAELTNAQINQVNKNYLAAKFAITVATIT